MSSVSKIPGSARLGLPISWLSRCAPATIWASFATAAVDDAATNQPSTSGCGTVQHRYRTFTLRFNHASPARNKHIGALNVPHRQEASIRSKDLGAAAVGAYYTIDKALLPEAGRQYAGAFYSPREAGHERRGGCKALQQEVAATGRHAVMYRPLMHTLFTTVGARDQGQQQRLLLSGPSGAGKSIALVSLVEWARQNGWCVPLGLARVPRPSLTALWARVLHPRRTKSWAT
jgi:small subunit ribosomal protein S29